MTRASVSSLKTKWCRKAAAACKAIAPIAIQASVECTANAAARSGNGVEWSLGRVNVLNTNGAGKQQPGANMMIQSTKGRVIIRTYRATFAASKRSKCHRDISEGK